MNCPIRTDPLPDEGHNQNPSDMANETNTNNSLNHRRNSTQGSRSSHIHLEDGSHEAILNTEKAGHAPNGAAKAKKAGNSWLKSLKKTAGHDPNDASPGGLSKLKKKLVKYSKFVGPGFMVSVAYIDPGKAVPPSFY